MNNPSSIACFLSVVRTGSYSDSAKELYLTRQAVSKNISNLESELGFPLFHQHYPTLKLTSAGKKMYDYYVQNDYDLSGARRIYQWNNHPNALRISWGTWMLPSNTMLDIVRDFARQNNITLNVIQGAEHEVLNFLRTGETDVAFFSHYCASFLQEPCTAFPVAEMPMFLGIAHNHPLSQSRQKSDIIRSLPYLTCPVAEKSTDQILGRVSRELLAFRMPPPSIQVLPNVETVFAQVMLGNGISVSPSATLFGYAVDSIPLKRSVSLNMVWLNRNQNPHIRTLQSWLEQYNNALDSTHPPLSFYHGNRYLFGPESGCME